MLQKLKKSVQDRGGGGQAILYGYKVATFPETLDHIRKTTAGGLNAYFHLQCMSLTYNPIQARVKVDPHAKNVGRRSSVEAWE